MSNSQKTPAINTSFLAGSETNIVRAIKTMTASLTAYATELPITFYGLCERRIDHEGNTYPALFQTNTKDWINCLANDQWKGYGFWDADDPEQYLAPDPEEAISRFRYSFIRQKVALIVYGDLEKLMQSEGTSNIDYRNARQKVKDQIIEVLSRKIQNTRGFFNLQAVYSQQLLEIFKGYSTKDRGEYLYLPKFGFRFEGELQVMEQCTYVAPP